MQLLQKVWSFGSDYEEMVHLWKVYCLSILEQSCVVWGGSLTTENVNDLERTQKTFCKFITLSFFLIIGILDVYMNSALKICAGQNFLRQNPVGMFVTFSKSA